MKNENDEVKFKPISFKTAVSIVVSLHILAALGIFAFTQKAKAQTISSDKEFLKNAEYVGVEYKSGNQTKTQTKIQTQDGFHVVSKGDTLYSIARKNKISFDKLVKLNGIKDVNKIIIGQKLKLK
jgi:LysM repeat protein